MSQITTIGRAGSRGKLSLMLLGTLAGLAAFGAAGAATPDSAAPSVVVHFDPQSLNTEAGVKALYWHIAAAAAKVCPENAFGDLAGVAQAEHCRNEAIARAIHQIDNPRLAAVYASHSHYKNS